MSYADFWSYYGGELALQWLDHLTVVAIVTVVGTIGGLMIAVLCYRDDRLSEWALRLSGLVLTIPSMALYVLLLGVFGLGWAPTLVALSLFALRPVVQNTIVGLRSVDASTVEAARGIGMSRSRTLWTIEMRLAWPLVMTGVRITATLLVTTATISAIVLGPGLGNAIYTGLKSLGTPSAMYFALTGIAGVITVGLLINAVLVIVERLTTPRGIRV